MLFTFNEKVKVINGFYTGQTGRIRKYTSWFTKKYMIYTDHASAPTFIWAKENDLDSLDFPNKRFSKKLNKIIE